MDRAQIDAEHVIARYLSAQLNATEEASFEEYCRQHPEIFQEVDSLLRMREGLAALRDRGELETLIERRRWWIPAAAAAAVVCVMVGLGVWSRFPVAHSTLLGTSAVQFKTESNRTLTVAGPYLLMKARDDQAPIELPLPSLRMAIEIRVLPSESDSTAQYGVAVDRLDPSSPPERVGDVHGLRVDPDRYVSIYLDSAQMRPGTYRLSVTRDSSSVSPAVAELFSLRFNPENQQKNGPR